MAQINRFKLLRTLVEQNDAKIKSTEDKLTIEVDRLYKKAVVKATEEFKALETLDAKADSEKVKVILNKMIEAFRSEFEKLVDPFQKNIADCYDESLEETSLLVGANEVSENN